MATLHQVFLIAHIVIGAVALIVFWIPMTARKGSPLHRKAGRYFLWGMTGIAISGIALSSLVLIDPVGIRAGGGVSMDEGFALAANARRFSLFLLMLSVLVLTTARHSTLVLQARGQRAALRTRTHVGLQISTGVLGVMTGVAGWPERNILLLVFAVISVNAAIGMLRYTFKASIAPREWLLEHIRFAIATGIAAYTAFGAFGGRALFAEVFSGQWQVVPWILPTVIGTAYSRYVTRQYAAARTLQAQPA